MCIHTNLIHGGFSLRRLLSTEERSTLISYLKDRFEIDPSFFDGFYFERTKRDIFMLPLDLQNEFKFETEKSGLRAFNGEKHPPKPTSTFVQRFGYLANAGFVELSGSDLYDFVNGKTVAEATSGQSNGYIIVRRLGVNVGCGFSREGNLESQFPLKTGRSISQKYL